MTPDHAGTVPGKGREGAVEGGCVGPARPGPAASRGTCACAMRGRYGRSARAVAGGHDTVTDLAPTDLLV